MRKYAAVTNGVGDDDESAYFRKDGTRQRRLAQRLAWEGVVFLMRPLPATRASFRLNRNGVLKPRGVATIIEMRNAPAVDLAVELRSGCCRG